MPGDLVTFKDCMEGGGEPIVIKIEELGLFGASVSIDGDEAWDMIDIDDSVAGIPLSQEILERNFIGHKQGSGYLTITKYELNEDFFVFASSDGIYLCTHYDDPEHAAHDDIFLVELRSVHELQHALRLFHIEKEIML